MDSCKLSFPSFEMPLDGDMHKDEFFLYAEVNVSSCYPAEDTIYIIVRKHTGLNQINSCMSYIPNDDVVISICCEEIISGSFVPELFTVTLNLNLNILVMIFDYRNISHVYR